MGGAGHGIQPGEMTLRQMLEGLNPHDHLCLIYESPQERIAAAVPFIAIGLKHGEKCIYVVDTSTADEVRSHLKEESIDVAAAERAGQLSILHESKAYTRGGSFDPDRMIAFLIEETERALAQGYPAVRITGEMTWVLRNLPGSEKLLEYEAKLNKDFFPRYPVLAICQYDRWKFDAEILKGVVITHPLLIKGGRIYQNFYYVPPEDFLSRRLAEVEVQHWLNNLERERQMKTELRQSEERYRTLTEQAGVGIVVLTEGPHIVYANPRYCEMTDYSREELYSLTPEQLKATVHPDDRERVWGYFRQRLAGENVPTSYEYCGIRKDGRVRWVEVYVSLIQYDGRPAVRSTVVDITERKKLEKALQDSETRYRRLFESSLDGIFILDGDSGEIIDANPFIMYRLGYSLEELQGKRLWELGFFEDVDKSKAAFEELKKKGYVRYEHLPLRAKNGRRIDVEFVSGEYEAGNRKFFQCNIRDITERKKMEQKLEQERAQLISLFDSITEAIYVSDPNTYEILFANRFIQSLFNKPLVGGLCYRELQGRESPCEFCTNDIILKLNGQPYYWEYHNPVLNRDFWIVDRVIKWPDGRDVRFELAIDVTERKSVQERYRTILTTTMDGFWLADMAGHFLEVNDAYCRMVGYTREELLNMSISDVEALETPEETAARISKIKELGGDRFESRHRRKDGTVIDVEVSVNYLPQEGGLMIVFVRDITERKKMEEALRRSEERFRTVLEEVDEGYYETDLRGNFTFVTDAISRQLGYSKEELVGMNYRKYVPQEEWDAVFQAFNGVYRTGQPLKRFGITNITKDGRRIFVEDTVLVRRDEKGEIVGFRGISRDVTERRQLEDALKESEREKSVILSTMSELVVRQDPQHRILWANRAAAQSVNLTPEELVGNYCHQIWHQSSQPCTGCPVAKARDTGEPQEGEITTPDGRRWLVRGYPVKDDSGRVVELIEVTMDITERKKAEEALKLSEERYRTLVENANEAIAVVQDGMIKFANAKVTELTGYTVDEINALPRGSLTHPDDREMVMEYFRRRLRGEQAPSSYQVRMYNRQGKLRWVQRNVAPITWEGKPAFLLMESDITELKAAEEAIRLSEERYRTVVENANEAIAVVQDGMIKFANAKVTELTGYSIEELNALPAQNLIHPDDREQVMEYHAKRMRGEPAPPSYELRIIDRQGNIKWLDRHVATITWEGKPAALVLDTDITGRKQMEEALRTSEQRYRTVLEEADEGYFELDLRGNMTFCGDAIVRALGYSKEELCGMNYRQLFPKEEWEANVQTFSRVYRTGETVRWFPGTAITKDGRRIFIERTVLPLRNEKGEIVGFRGVARDVTERRKAEEEKRHLELRAQMASRLASVGEMAAGVAHEINNPLTGVVGYAQILLSRQDLPEDVKRDLKVINDGAQRVAGIVQRLLAFSRQTKPERRPVNINQLIESTLALRAYSLRTSNIEVITMLDPRLPDTVVDPGQIQQVLLNLIINAEQALKEVRRKGKLTIITRKKGSIIEIKVRDNGPGIKPEIMDRIFDPFFTTRPAGEGTGLGLSLCYGIVNEHNGRIYARSKPGRGATFIVELPVITEEPQPIQLPIELKAELAGARILVVDDEPVIREFVSAALGEQGCEVDTAARAEEALEKIQNQRYHLVLIDVKMPGMSGIELYRRAQRIARSLARRVVFITGDVVSPETESFLAENRLPSLAKPFSASELVDKVRLALAGRR